MSDYKCFNCGKNLTKEQMRKRVRCVYCGYKVVYKSRSKPSIVEAI